jgi:hypothetical protein
MGGEVTLELAVDTKDEETLRAIEQALGGVSPQRWQDTRDIITIITVVSSAVALINALLDLKNKLSKQESPPPSIVIKNVNRLELTLPNATVDSLQALIRDTDA